MLTSELDYSLPERLIAQYPAVRRDESRLLVVDRGSGAFTETVFGELANHLESGDCLVLNDTRVIRARLQATKDTGGKVEVFLLRERSPGEWEALVRPSARVRPGSRVTIGDVVHAQIDEPIHDGARVVRFDRPDVLGVLESVGAIPLPPYIRRETGDPADAERYQTIYAARPGAVAAPTAGLHFSPALFSTLDNKMIRRAFLTLHVGYGTFKPIQAERIETHQVDPEEFDLPAETAAALNETRSAGARVVAVGTTSVRVLESQFCDGKYRAGHGATRLCIFPPYKFRAVDALVTNFHLPRSSLLALVCAFAGKDLTFAAYHYAIEKEFRFYSYGDAMLIV
jgi:S-adenosylmethionine:tRNA ribosyltransferase-isomerase